MKLNIALVIVLGAVSAAPSRSRAIQATITVTNNSSREIAHLYTSPVDRKEWSEDRLAEGDRLQNGESVTVSNVISENDQVKVIAEDKDGCFSYFVASGDDPTWSINNATAKDCGS